MESSTCEWKSLPKNMGNPLHSLCSYMAMFPPSVPNHFINKYSSKGDRVLDPFSGRGTTILEACLLERVGIGNDRNPLAFVLTKSKADIPSKSRILSRIKELEKKFASSDIDISKENPNIRMIFSDSTLKQLVFLKNNLKWKARNVDSFITALLLGVMHGSSEGFLSLSMPNTFSMAPNYVKKFIAEHDLKKPNRNAFELLRRKLERCYQESPIKGKALNKDVRKLTGLREDSIDLIITSPPYTRVIRYGQFNWIRLWLLGEDCKEVDKKLFFSQSMDKYCLFMQEALAEMMRVLKPKSKAVLVIGDVKDREKETIQNLAQIVWERSAKPLGFKLVEPIIEDSINDSTKVSKIWGDKKGNATKIDRILILEK